MDVNEEAIQQGVRYIEVDINRTTPDGLSEVYEKRRKQEVIDIGNTYETVIDVHGTKSDCGIVTIITNATIANVQAALEFPADAHIIWQTLCDSKQGPLVQFIETSAFEIEVGRKDDMLMHKKLGEAMQDYVLGTPKTLTKDVYIVTSKLVGGKNIDKDFTKVTIEDTDYYSFLSTNGYENVNCMLMEKIELKNLILDAPKRINLSTKVISF